MIENENFKFVCAITKAYEYHDLMTHATKKRLQGLASGIGIDREGERMSRSVIESFKKTIETGILTDAGEWSYIPLVSEHRKNGLGEPQWDQVLGHVTKAWIDEDYNLWIEAELDEENPNALYLYSQVTKSPEEGKPRKLGLSIGGKVLEAGMEWDEELNRAVPMYYAVGLGEITVTSAPAYNSNRYLVAMQKSVDWEKVQEAYAERGPNTKDETMKVEKNASEDVQVEEVEKNLTETEDQSAEEITKEVEEVADPSVDKAQAEDADEADEVVVKSEGQVDESALYVTTAAFETLTSTVEELAKAVGTLAETFEKSVHVGLIVDEPAEEASVEEVEHEQVVEDQAEESEEVEEETDPVERSLNMDDFLDRISKMIDDKINPLTKSLETRLEELSNEEVDKSVVPSRANNLNKSAKEEESKDEFENIHTARGFAAIKAAFDIKE